MQKGTVFPEANSPRLPVCRSQHSSQSPQLIATACSKKELPPSRRANEPRSFQLGSHCLSRKVVVHASKWLVKIICIQNGTMVRGFMDQNLRSISWFNFDPYPNQAALPELHRLEELVHGERGGELPLLLRRFDDAMPSDPFTWLDSLGPRR